MFISYTYIQVNKQGPRDDHQDNQLPKYKLGPGTWLAIARSPQDIEDYIRLLNDFGVIREGRWEARGLLEGGIVPAEPDMVAGVNAEP